MILCDDFDLAAHRKGIHGGQAKYKFEKLVLNLLSMRLIEGNMYEMGLGDLGVPKSYEKAFDCSW